jgi:hypothetical protein
LSPQDEQRLAAFVRVFGTHKARKVCSTEISVQNSVAHEPRQADPLLVNTKHPIVDFFADHLPEYRFIGDRRPNLVFQYSQPSGIYRCIAVQRDSPSHGLAIQIAATYSRHWRGEPAYPIGFDTGLANLKLRSRTIEAMQYWEFYEPTPDGLRRTLTTIHHQFRQLAPAFFEQAESSLLSSRLLQIALSDVRRISPEERAGLPEALDAVKCRLDHLEHPVFLRLRDRLRAAWTPNVSKEERQATSRLAYDCLVFTSA